MRELDTYKYTPPEQEMLPEEAVLKDPLPSTEVKLTPYQEQVLDLINRYDLIVHLCDYVCDLIDQNMSHVSVEMSPEDYPEVYASFKRLFPNTTSDIMTYEQYRDLCKFRMDMVSAGVY